MDANTAAARRHRLLQIAHRRARPGAGSSLAFLRSRRTYPMPDLNASLGDVCFVVIGGTATASYMPARLTDAVDVLIETADTRAAAAALTRAGARRLGPFMVGGSAWLLPDGITLDVLESTEPWLRDAFATAVRDEAGLPIIGLPYLVLLKLRASRAIDLFDLSRMLGGAEWRRWNRFGPSWPAICPRRPTTWRA